MTFRILLVLISVLGLNVIAWYLGDNDLTTRATSSLDLALAALDADRADRHYRLEEIEEAGIAVGWELIRDESGASDETIVLDAEEILGLSGNGAFTPVAIDERTASFQFRSTGATIPRLTTTEPMEGLMVIDTETLSIERIRLTRGDGRVAITGSASP